jgi:cysteine-rich repeat protein
MTNVRASLVVLGISLSAVASAVARTFTIPSPLPFAAGGVSGTLLPAPNVDGCAMLGSCPRDFLAFRVALDAGSAPLQEVQVTIPDRPTANGAGYTSSIVDRQPDGVGFLGVGDSVRWFWPNPPRLQGGERTSVLVAAYYDGDLPGSVGGAFLFIDEGDISYPGPEDVALIESTCGNGTVDGGGGLWPETCDDGNAVDDDCCSESCVASADGAACSDHTACTTGETCTALTCGGGTPVTCGACEDCFPQAGCAPVPQAPVLCRTPFTPGRSKLVLRNKANPKADLVNHKWLKGSQTDVGDFGTPETTDGWDLCIFDGTGDLVLGAAAPAGGTCGTRPCWRAIGSRGFRYKDRDRTPSGMDKLTMKAGGNGLSSVVATGKGGTLDMPALGNFAFPLHVQVLGDNGECFYSVFEAQNAARNTSELFVGRSTN